MPTLPDGALPATPKPKTPEEKLHAALTTVRFDRTPDGIFSAVGELQKLSGSNAGLQKDKAKAAAMRLRLLANAGRWQNLGEFIRSLPFDGTPAKAYGHLVSALLRAPTTKPSVPPTSGARPLPVGVSAPTQSKPTNRPRPVLTQEDFVAILGIAPAEPGEAQIKSLSSLLRALGQVNLAMLAKKLESGAGMFGGDLPIGRKRAAQLLFPLATGSQADLALGFVPENDEDWALEMRAELLNRLWQVDRARKRVVAVKRRARFDRAWAANEKLIALAKESDKRVAAVKRGFGLAGTLPEARAEAWMRQQFGDGGQGLELIRLIQSEVQRNVRSSNFILRENNLKNLQQVLGTLLSGTRAAAAEWRVAVSVATEAWLAEAENTSTHFRKPVARKVPYDPYLEQQRMKAQQNSTRNKPLAPKVILENAPGENWHVALPMSQRGRVWAALANVHLKDNVMIEALGWIEKLAGPDPYQAKQLVNTLLGNWAQARNPGGGNPRTSAVYRTVYYPPRPTGVPLTRAKQQRNLRELADILARLRALPIDPPTPHSIVSAFEGAHSAAEVYKRVDIELVFGSPEGMPLDSLATLSQSIRRRLAAQWRAPQVQQQAGTKRQEPQIKAEVTQGYDMLLTLLVEGLEAHPDHWRLKLQQAAANFDLAEYQYGNKEDLAVYVAHRETAFGAFSEAADLYRAQLSGTGAAPNAAVFELWFNANLGASDLSYVTRQQVPEEGNLLKIRRAILSLPETDGDHMKAFGESVERTSKQLQPELKPRYLRASLVVLDGHPSGAAARKLVRHYDDLLDEIDLVARIDGDAEVGHGQPFGLFLGLQHTTDIEREAGGFARYLTGGNNNRYYGPVYPGQRQAPRDDLEDHLGEKLGANFEVLSITFHDNKVQSRTIGKPGWRETPLAYVLLQAEDASVDRLPPLQMDLDFFDELGPVILPKTTPPLVVDARPENPPARPVDKLEITQTLDTREEGEKGTLSLEIHATCKGLAPALEKLVRIDPPGFKIAATDDSGPSVARVESDANSVHSVTERTWLLTLRPTSDQQPEVFQFPAPVASDIKTTFKQYLDANLVEVDAQLALEGVLLKPAPILPWVFFGLGIVGGGLVVWRLAKRSVGHTTEKVSFRVPQECTPFAVIDLLQRIDRDPAPGLIAAHQDELQSVIHDLENSYFSPGATPVNDRPDLQTIAREWVSKVG